MKNQNKIGLLAYPGSPLTYPTVEALQGAGYKEIAIICDGDRPNEKFMQIISERTEGMAIFHQLTDFKHLGVPFYFVDNHNSDDCLNLIKNLGIDILGSCGTPRKLKTSILQSCRYGVVNCHPGQLPHYRGSSTVEWALLNGDPVAATAHFMTEDYDAGPIIKVYPFETKGLTYAEIRLKMIQHQAVSLADAIGRVLQEEKIPAHYPSQPEGKLWTVFPQDQLASLQKRRF
jgi:methionyl-tRNA formyltransferase